LLDFIIFNSWINVLLLPKWNHLADSEWNYIATVIEISSEWKGRHVILILGANEVAVTIKGPMIITILVESTTLHQTIFIFNYLRDNFLFLRYFVVLFTKQIICTLIELCERIFDSCNILDHKFLSALNRIVVSRYWFGILRMFIFIIINSRYIIILIVYIGGVSRRLFLLIEVLLKWCYFLNSRLILFGKHLSYYLIIASFFHRIRLLSDWLKSWLSRIAWTQSESLSFLQVLLKWQLRLKSLNLSIVDRMILSIQ
jgi:hypothetical protein